MITLQDRKNAVLRQMEADGVDVLVIASNGRHMIDVPDAVVHMTGFLCLGPSLMILNRGGGTRVIATPTSDGERLAERCGDSMVIACDDLVGTFSKAWQDVPKSRRTATVGIDSLEYREGARLLEIIGPGAASFDAAFFSTTARKTETEIENARLGIVIAEAGWQRLLEFARPGMRECDLGIELNLYMKSLGANDSFLMLNAGPQSLAVMPSSERRLEKGDILLVELSPSCGGQFVQICRTASIGPPSEELVAKYQLLCAAAQDGLATIRPGVKLSEICDAIDRRMADAGFAEYSRPPHLRRRGHGLGCGSTAPGDVAFDNPTPVGEDMIFMVHPNQFLPGPGYMMCGEPVRVSAAGVEVLTKNAAQLGVIEA